jgi:four helix bundle protein
MISLHERLSDYILTTSTESIICKRSFDFALRILQLCRRLLNGDPIQRFLGSQLIRCGTSIGANAEEAQEGQTKADYIAKMSISSKEARETSYWLRLAVADRALNAQEAE